MQALFFLHTGRSEYLTALGYRDYLPCVLGQAKRTNPDTPVILIGDEHNAMLAKEAGVEHHLQSRYDVGAAEFRQRYVHLSRNSVGGERFCFERWFVVRDFCRIHGIDSFACIDSDVLVFSNLTARRAALAEHDFSLSDGTCGHLSFWSRLEVLEAFCDYVMRVYAFDRTDDVKRVMDFYRPFAANGWGGGVCDMTLLKWFATEPGWRTVEMTTIVDRATFDHNINMSRNGDIEFAMRGGVKRITWKSGRPHGIRMDNGGLVAFDCLHCQGPAKRCIPRLVAGRPPVSIQMRASRALRAASDARRSFLRSLKPLAKSLIQKASVGR